MGTQRGQSRGTATLMQDRDGMGSVRPRPCPPPQGVTWGPEGGEQQPSALRTVRSEAHDMGKVGLWLKLRSLGRSQPVGQGEEGCSTL